MNTFSKSCAHILDPRLYIKLCAQLTQLRIDLLRLDAAILRLHFNIMEAAYELGLETELNLGDLLIEEPDTARNPPFSGLSK